MILSQHWRALRLLAAVFLAAALMAVPRNAGAVEPMPTGAEVCVVANNGDTAPQCSATLRICQRRCAAGLPEHARCVVLNLALQPRVHSRVADRCQLMASGSLSCGHGDRERAEPLPMPLKPLP